MSLNPFCHQFKQNCFFSKQINFILQILKTKRNKWIFMNFYKNSRDLNELFFRCFLFKLKKTLKFSLCQSRSLSVSVKKTWFFFCFYLIHFLYFLIKFKYFFLNKQFIWQSCLFKYGIYIIKFSYTRAWNRLCFKHIIINNWLIIINFNI